MKNILIVTAHPSPHGHTHIIAHTYAEASRRQNHDVKIVDLYAKENQSEFLKFENIREYTPSKVQKTFQEQVTWAHEIVVVHPIWWGLPPAIMKNWVELTFWAKFAYKYFPDGSIDKMLTGKTAKIFATAGGASWYHYLPILPLFSFWKLCVFGFFGVDVIDFKVCGNLDKHKKERCDKDFQKYLRKITKSASSH